MNTQASSSMGDQLYGVFAAWCREMESMQKSYEFDSCSFYSKSPQSMGKTVVKTDNVFKGQWPVKEGQIISGIQVAICKAAFNFIGEEVEKHLGYQVNIRAILTSTKTSVSAEFNWKFHHAGKGIIVGEHTSEILLPSKSEISYSVGLPQTKDVQKEEQTGT